ncbi:TetR family transcriptional regulator [Epibacterium sp. SM1969]|uniref:TetR family transcriptional regulator n=1 Tax=Tritonibacter aquimaris TaxID=2663379 RepID=A0A844APJ8_9RHOB|nr:TetR/AcrR family transcriptional regulator [Tritonibacter aquimaris]MQY42653.1 TetR family transcriptional regulator [Tritonibacter aquimaris]
MARTQGSHSDITGPRIRAAALKLFAQHGYAAVSMRQIAKEVGVQAGALYNYIPDKQSLLLTLMENHMEEVLSAWQETEAGIQPDDVIARLKTFTRFHIRFHMQRPDAVFIAYMELRNLSEENFARIEALRSQYEGKLRQILQDGVASGRFEISDSKITTLAVIGMLNGVITWYREGGRLSLDEVEGIYWNMVQKAVLPTAI